MSVIIEIPAATAQGGYALVPPPPPPPWLPSELGSALRGWWVPHSLGLTAGDLVASLPSSGGVTNTLTQGTTGLKPAYQLFNGTGKGALSFDGADDYMLFSDKSVSNAATAVVMFMLYQHASIITDAAYKYMMNLRVAANTNPRMSLILNNTAGATKFIGLNYKETDASVTTTRMSATAADVSPHLLVAQIIFSGTGSPKLDIWRDGTNILNETPGFTPAALPATDSSNCCLGGNGSTANSGMNGLIGQAGVIKGSISLADRQKLEGYLAWYGGIQANLPSDHPHKSAAPTL